MIDLMKIPGSNLDELNSRRRQLADELDLLDAVIAHIHQQDQTEHAVNTAHG